MACTGSKRRVNIEESACRLPAAFANLLYLRGETRMDHTVFTVLFSNGIRQAYRRGNAVDFVRYPAGMNPADVVQVLPHHGPGDGSALGAPPYHWCLYSGITK